MRRFTLTLGIIAAISTTLYAAEADEIDRSSINTLPKIAVTPFTAFTGKISKSKVRMRIAPTLDAGIVRELNRNELLIVVGETDDFFAVQPPSDVKGYVFRTFILDNYVEGNRVNVRLSPTTEAPIIAQLTSGERVDGTITPSNSKWLEINPPLSTKFFVSKEYIEKVGDQYFMAKVAKRREEVNQLLQSTYAVSQQEFQKNFPEMHLDRIVANYQKIMKDYSDFPEQAARAGELIEELNENYLHKKIAYLEARAENRTLTKVNEPQPSFTVEPIGFPMAITPPDYSLKMVSWEPIEKTLYEEWSNLHNGTMDQFYAEENPIVLMGIIEPYSRAVKNKPGDYMLVDQETRTPLAFLYSTKVNLSEKMGQRVTIQGLERPRNNFAYPAFYVNSIH